jgi:electron transport complex protein RnfD
MTRVITWHIPVSCMAAVAVFGAVFGYEDFRLDGAVFHLFTGGAMLGAFFIATDYVTSPLYPKGKLIFGAGVGVLTMVIRLWAGYPEGVSFAVLLMNATVPLLDRYTKPKKFGVRKLAVEGGN